MAATTTSSTPETKQKPITIRCDQNRRIEVAPGHFYNSTCRCIACLEHWLGFAAGMIVVLSHDGQHRMVPPGSKHGTVEPPKTAKNNRL